MNSLARPPWRCTVIVLVCGLTLAASGDDVCLLRLAPASLPAKAVFLDDPNADFTASDNSKLTFPSDVNFSPATPGLATSLSSSPFQPALTVDSLYPSAFPTPPLRC